MKKTEWLLCPVCRNKTRSKIREDTVLEKYPLYCPKCKQEITTVGKCGKKSSLDAILHRLRSRKPKPNKYLPINSRSL
ncbi:MAG: hypothetical protein IJK01_05810 [Clostridia bacterium]|nr:hypothetical protein [Clostridia bacterium]